MKKFILILLVVALIAGGLWLYLVSTTPRESAGVHFPLNRAQRRLLAGVPATAESFALIPTVAAVEGKLLANPTTRGLVTKWSETQDLPQSWMLGAADVVIWRTGKQTTYLVRLDPLRAVLARTYLMLYGDTGARVLINAPQETPMSSAELDTLLDLTRSLPNGDVLIVQREGARGAFPPINRPAATSISITTAAIDIVSVAPRGGQAILPVQSLPDGQAGLPVLHRFANSAILSANFTEAPRAIEDMNRLVGAKAAELLKEGGTIVLYDVDTNKLLPRPREVIVLPSTPERRAALDDFVKNAAPKELREAVGVRIETAEAPNELLLAFDRKSIDSYLKDTFEPPALSGNRWSMRVDPHRAVPMLEQLSDNPGLRYLAPRLFRSARDLSSWIGELENARFIEAASSETPDAEELRVRIASK